MTACTQPGCGGSIEDGYCNVCGMPPEASAPTPAPTSTSSAPVSHASHSGGTSVSARLGSTPLGSARAAGTRPTRRLVTNRTRTQHLGAGITSVPAAPVPDPRSVVLKNAEVAEEKRFCAACGAPVGRSHDGQPGRTSGFCPKCRTEYGFSPKLGAGDLAGGQYEVVGCLAHGGLGWIYLARDHNVSDRYVVLKGLLNTGDKDAFEAAVAERQFLAAVQHPLVVEIYNFTQYEGSGYIVMEYVGGRSLKQILKDRMAANGGHYDPFPVDQAIAYIVEILPAFSYLHGLGLLYCDFKPDNVVQAGDNLKLIDLGGVRRIDDATSAIFGTVGFQAPEVAEIGPSIASDIFTIGRTLAVLVMEFRGYQSTYVTTLPDVADAPLFQQQDSLYRVLAKATAQNPDDRFQSVDELRDLLLGVLRETVATAAGKPATSSNASPLFESPVATDAQLLWEDLPLLRVDPADPAAAWLAGVSVSDSAARLEALKKAPDHTIEVRLAITRAFIEAGNHDEATRIVDATLAENPWEWRAVWMSGLLALSAGDAHAATTAFNTVVGQVPGELAPKLALAVACEGAGDGDVAEQLYATCTMVDAAYVAPAAFGLARVRGRRGDVAGALAALDLVRPTSSAYISARCARTALLSQPGRTLSDLADAITSFDAVALDARNRQTYVVSALELALAAVLAGGEEPAIRIAGVPATEHGLRVGAESAYRQLASLTENVDERVRLVDAANKIRPRTLR
ncbi:MAG: serine/threonine protein kinase [Actinomycetia bacterium]|nr:serine/threonine protein kinase [Actinomycetes bacterium]